jgi:Flp pilus assembly protein TadG
MRRRTTSGEARDEGSIMLLALGCVSIALILVVVVVDASAVFLARRSLSSATDGASLAAAQSVSSRSVYLKGAGAWLPLGEVGPLLAGAGHASELRASVTHETTGDTVVVMGRRSVRLPFASFLGIGALTVTATSRASSVRLGTAP